MKKTAVAMAVAICCFFFNTGAPTAFASDQGGGYGHGRGGGSVTNMSRSTAKAGARAAVYSNPTAYGGKGVGIGYGGQATGYGGESSLVQGATRVDGSFGFAYSAPSFNPSGSSLGFASPQTACLTSTWTDNTLGVGIPVLGGGVEDKDVAFTQDLNTECACDMKLARIQKAFNMGIASLRGVPIREVYASVVAACGGMGEYIPIQKASAIQTPCVPPAQLINGYCTLPPKADVVRLPKAPRRKPTIKKTYKVEVVPLGACADGSECARK